MLKKEAMRRNIESNIESFEEQKNKIIQRKHQEKEVVNNGTK